MPHQPHYTSLATQVFSQYLDQAIDLETLILKLREIELQLLSDEEEDDDEVSTKQVWFRFFDGDAMQTTISDIENELSDSSHPSSKILLRGIAFGLANNELQVHFG
ncbi:hypothetical protein [Pontibacter fetidus]|uniref:Uncharacterized protein n=1 Tax=Pontibacter fetidus TaxID=2700082 RepID=A0A6B2H498_9BACT|nr:hypothetical protein [Pontibacter fetidus]NDK55446.1 hypothetical protein [Pontibacter fetidus]